MRVVFVLLAVVVMAFLLGPRAQVTDAWTPLPESTNPAEWVAQRASAFDDIVPGTEDRLIWADSTRARTPLSVVYIHGFSGSPGMAFPFVDSVAAGLGANAFIARLSGHGRTPEALGKATLAEWVQDAANAISIGAQIGDRVVLVGLSTGGTLASWAASQPGLRDRLAALVLISPNVAPRDPKADMLLWPWGNVLLRVVAGETRHWEPFSEAHSRYTTNDYPSGVLLEMMASVKLLRRQDPGQIQAPVLVLLSGMDQVVSPQATHEWLSRIPTHTELIDVGDVGDPSDHVIVGDALSPDNTMPAVRHVEAFIEASQRESP